MYFRDLGDPRMRVGSVTPQSVYVGGHGDEDKGRLSDSVSLCIREIKEI